ALYVASALPVIVLVRERFVRPTLTHSLVGAMRRDFAMVMRERSLLFPMVAALLALCGSNVATPVLSLLVGDIEGKEHQEALAGVAFFVMGLTSALAAGMMGRLISRFGYRRLISVTAPV